MDSDLQSVRDNRSIPISVGIVTDDPARAAVLSPLIVEQGWDAVVVEAYGPTSSRPDDFSLLVFSLAHVSPGYLEMIASAGIQGRKYILVVADDRNPQAIADALRSGADDYIVSPFAPAEFVARMRSLVTRIWPSTDRRTGEGIKFDDKLRTIQTGPYAVEFTPLEWDVLTVLIEQDGMPLAADAIVDSLYVREVQASTIPTIISRIRRKLASQGFQAISVTTVQNRGYVAQFRRSSDQRRGAADANRNVGSKRARSSASMRSNDSQRLRSVG